VACPYFFPKEKCLTVAWAFPNRLPLGSGFCGTCHAPTPAWAKSGQSGSPGAGREEAEAVPDDNTLRDFCNLGHARGCTRFPADRRADSIRFAVAEDEGEHIILHYVYDRDHLPVAHGQLAYDCVQQRWLSIPADACLERQAECYLAVYLERRPRPLHAGVAQ
jgi:hypothetical protein